MEGKSQREKKEFATLRAGFKYILISLLWVGLEWVLYGEPRPSTEDTIISFFLFWYIDQCEFRKLDLPC